MDKIDLMSVKVLILIMYNRNNAIHNTPADGINVYSFAIHPEEHQPSGTANFSRIDTSTLILTFADSTQTGNLPSLNLFNTNNQLYIFGTNYNVLRCYAGLAGLAYTG